MPLLFTILACSIMMILQLTTAGFFGQQTKTYQSERERANQVEAVRSVGPAVRDALELWMRVTNSGAAVCPAGTVHKRARRSNSSFVDLCWRKVSGDDECLRTREANPLWICPMEDAPNTFARRGWMRILMEQAQAAPVNLSPLSPGAYPVPGGGVRINTPNCGVTGAPCISCESSGTTCLTITFCISRTQKKTCAQDERVVQTFAFRR